MSKPEQSELSRVMSMLRRRRVGRPLSEAELMQRRANASKGGKAGGNGRGKAVKPLVAE